MPIRKAEVARPAPHARRMEYCITRADGMLIAFGRMGCGALLLDSTGIVKQMNDEAKSHIGFGISLTNGKLTASHQTTQRDLELLITQAARLDTETAMRDCTIALPRLCGRPLIAQILLSHPWISVTLREVWPLLLLIDPDRARRPEETVLRKVFALTPAESRLAIGLAGGQGLGNVAIRLGIRPGTARVQLSNVFAKTGAKSQPELAALLERMAGAFPAMRPA